MTNGAVHINVWVGPVRDMEALGSPVTARAKSRA